MNVYNIRKFWFDDFLDTSGDWQRAYLTVADFGTQNVSATAQLNLVSPGADIAINDNTITGEIGGAAVGFKWYEYVDDSGFHHVDNTYFVPHLFVRNCVGFQVELAYRKIWVGAVGLIFFFTD